MKDSLEDELSTCNESVGTEPSFVDENLVFNESQRVPFFKVSARQVSAAAAGPRNRLRRQPQSERFASVFLSPAKERRQEGGQGYHQV